LTLFIAILLPQMLLIVLLRQSLS